MALPDAIQREADAAAAALAAQNTPTGEVVLTDPSQLAPQPTATASAPAEPVPTAPQPPAAENWEHKYRSLQGIFAQRTGELQAQNKVQESKLVTMQQQLDVLMRAQQQEVDKARSAPDPKDVENFGADMVEMVRRYNERYLAQAMDQIKTAFTDLDKRVSTLETTVQGVDARSTETLEQQYYVALKAAVPDWETVNADPRWLQWLAEVDPVYGQPRQAALDHSRATLNVQQTAAVFGAFKAAFPVQPKPSLASQVAPNSAGAQAPAVSAPVMGPVITEKFMERFYNDVAKGRYAGREAEQAEIESQIQSAVAQGRVR